jgi:hypothetical protein
MQKKRITIKALLTVGRPRRTLCEKRFNTESLDRIPFEKLLPARLILDTIPLFSDLCREKVSTFPLCISCLRVATFFVKYVQLNASVTITHMGTRWNKGLNVNVSAELVPGNWKLHCTIEVS